MSELEQLLENVSTLTPFTIALVAFVGLIVGAHILRIWLSQAYSSAR